MEKVRPREDLLLYGDVPIRWNAWEKPGWIRLRERNIIVDLG